ncbi:GNAT family N-acetyltransferase [Cellulomonas sp. ATA003]|uniref:GNAT family N-acetyltransferase n=1 Tax=Cellulomonas sp. ATA003 TaxID=3073064 RepID=UPI002872C328|nr:GNAT family N-acetyltransferase [Cellulomonas sp. ATA003]WNB85491.1 GNAT family N-acetyltransferase [Cellulomonas sp. ATA003]
MPYTVITIRPEQWVEFRDIRLRMLEDAPIAFGETLEHAQATPEAGWLARVTRATQPDRTAVAAVDDDGTWVGTMSAYLSESGAATVAAVWVDPEHRGADAGVTDRLMEAIVEWARTTARASRLRLSVHEKNERAAAYFARAGFAPTGETQPYELEPGGSLRIMQRDL